MILSMTGYGDAQRSVDGVAYLVELRSVNNRYFKASIKLPESFQFLESEVEKLLRSRLTRGTVSCVLWARNDGTTLYQLNQAALQGYVDQICATQLPPGVHATVDLASVAMMPGVCQMPMLDEETRARYWSILAELLEEALGKLVEMRQVEGEALGKDLLAHCERGREVLEDIRQRAPLVVKDYQQKLGVRVQLLLNEGRVELDKDSLSREVAVFAERCDISEEIARLGSHLDQFCTLCRGSDHAGRKLDFLAQELLREINTVGSKANDSEIARCVVEVKGLIDRLKEQVQNVE